MSLNEARLNSLADKVDEIAKQETLEVEKPKKVKKESKKK